MAPARVLKGNATQLPVLRKGISTRSQNQNGNDPNGIVSTTRGKRKADASSPLKNDKIKRSALGNITNAVAESSRTKLISKKPIITGKKSDILTKKTQILGENIKPVINTFAIPSASGIVTRATKILTRAAARKGPDVAWTSTIVKPKENTAESQKKPNTRRISNEFEKTEDSLYMSALEDETTPESVASCESQQSEKSNSLDNNEKLCEILPPITNEPNSPFVEAAAETVIEKKNSFLSVARKFIDFDKENWSDPFQVSMFASEIFHYLKERENMFVIKDYIEKQSSLSKWMRALLVDWMVEVQESFELNHETLYLAVKIVDIYLGKVLIAKDDLQLLGAVAILISCKYDERTPPFVDDFLFICDGAYTRRQLICMEMTVLKSIGYDLGIPLSYRFLRRYARCEKISMPVLTLARFILEFSLMDYATISLSDSKLACAAMFIALRMSGKPGWNSNLEYHTGYNLCEFADIVALLNNGLLKRPKDALQTVRNKYSHEIFFKVSRVQLLSSAKLFESTDIDVTSFLTAIKGRDSL